MTRRVRRERGAGSGMTTHWASKRTLPLPLSCSSQRPTWWWWGEAVNPEGATAVSSVIDIRSGGLQAGWREMRRTGACTSYDHAIKIWWVTWVTLQRLNAPANSIYPHVLLPTTKLKSGSKVLR